MGTKTEALLASDVSIIEIDELRPLILEGQERGFLTFEQITSLTTSSKRDMCAPFCWGPRSTKQSSRAE